MEESKRNGMKSSTTKQQKLMMIQIANHNAHSRHIKGFKLISQKVSIRREEIRKMGCAAHEGNHLLEKYEGS